MSWLRIDWLRIDWSGPLTEPWATYSVDMLNAIVRPIYMPSITAWLDDPPILRWIEES